MKKSKLIALSALSAAFAVIFMVIGAYIPTLDYSAIFMASLCMMIPLTKKSIKSALLTYLATALLSSILVAGRWEVVLPFVLFFGLHPIINYFQKEKHINKFLALAVKDVWFVLTILLVNVLFKNFIAVETAWMVKYLNYIIIFGGGIAFIVYDFLMMHFQRAMDVIVYRLKL